MNTGYGLDDYMAGAVGLSGQLVTMDGSGDPENFYMTVRVDRETFKRASEAFPAAGRVVISREVSQNSSRPGSERDVTGEHAGAPPLPDSVCDFCGGEHVPALHPTDEEAARRLWTVIRLADKDVVRLADRLRRIQQIIDEHRRDWWLTRHGFAPTLEAIEGILNEERR